MSSDHAFGFKYLILSSILVILFVLNSFSFATTAHTDIYPTILEVFSEDFGTKISIEKKESNNVLISFNVNISDIESGIAKVEYGWDLDRELCNDEFNMQTGNYLGFRQNEYTDQYVEYHFDDSQIVQELNLLLELNYEDSVWVKGCRHTVYIRVTNNAGNVTCESLQDSVGSDMLAPNITGVEIRKTEVSKSESVLRFSSLGTFSNDSVEVVVNADDNESREDVHVSGISSVTINDRLMTKNAAGEYVLTVSAVDMLSDMRITVEDSVGWTTTAAITDIPDPTGLLKSSELVIENSKPAISWAFSAEGHLDDSGNIWYGIDEAEDTLEITVSDDNRLVESGLYAVKITDNGKTIYEKEEPSTIEFEFTKTYTIGDLADGVHEITVVAEDNAGNIVTDTKNFYIDSILPECGDIFITNPEGLNINGKHWFDKDELISFRLYCSDADAGLKSVLININERSFWYEGKKILSDDVGNYVAVDTKGIRVDDEHRYIVTAVVTDFANNSLELEPLIVYKDLDNPLINKLTVEKKDPDPEKGVNVLGFGTYSNDTLVFKAHVSDAEYDAGVDYVTVFYDGLSDPEVMHDEGDGVYSVEIPAGEEITEYHISATAYDIFGRSSKTSPNLENAVTGDLSNSSYVMVEAIKPSMSFQLFTDDESSLDGKMWFSSNQSMELKVQDAESGIRNVEFSVNGIQIISDKNGIALPKASETERAGMRNTEELSYIFDSDYLIGITGVPEDGRYSIHVETTDNAGNISTYETEYYIDMSAPQIDRIEFSPSTADGINDTEEFIERLEYGFFFKTDFKVTVYASDELPSAGLDEIIYRFIPYQNGVRQEEVTGSQNITDGKVELAVPQGFKGQIIVEAVDNLGNRSGEKASKAYIVDRSAPEIKVDLGVSTPYVDAKGNGLYVVNNIVTVEVTDTVSGIKEIGYAQSSELNSYDRMSIVLNNNSYRVGDNLGDGWIVSAVDANLVTKVTKSFELNSDDNDIILTFDATDNALNFVGNIQSQMFTIDKTRPIINVTFRTDEGIDGYYNQNRIADIIVIERNFDEKLITAIIENGFGEVPSFSFIEQSATVHSAVINFDEGDYTFDISGRDLGDQEAVVTFDGGNEKYFFVDKTSPVIEDDFTLLVDTATENSFSYDKTIHIQVTEHNFNPALSQLRISRKDAGENHDTNGLVDVTYEVLRDMDWNSSGDIHTIEFTLSEDAVYQVELAPVDLAGNYADRRATVVFEIDKMPPVVTAKNAMSVSQDNTETVDFYSYLRQDDPAPTVEFEDVNFDRIYYNLTVYIPDNTSSEADTVIRPNKVYLEEDTGKTGTIQDHKFVLPDFVEDGIYTVELVAVDVAGNESLLNVNTYARMVEQDVLAYIMESNLAQKSGLYSFQYENGVAISKRPDDFEDIQICVLAKKVTDVEIVLRDSNGNEIVTNAQAAVDNSVYGIDICNYTLPADFFKENFQDDTDLQLILTVKNEGNRIDLGKMHIDNIAPTCDVPVEFKSWHWYYGEDARTITISNISELIDESQCKVYDHGKEIAFTYSSEDNAIMFTLEKGWHDVGIVLSDVAGNAYYIQEQSNIYIGLFWLWVIVAGAAAVTVLVIYVIIYHIGKKRAEENSE